MTDENLPDKPEDACSVEELVEQLANATMNEFFHGYGQLDKLRQFLPAEMQELAVPTVLARRKALALLLDEVQRGHSRSFANWIDRQVIDRLATILHVVAEQAGRITQLELQVGYWQTELQRFKQQVKQQQERGRS